MADKLTLSIDMEDVGEPISVDRATEIIYAWLAKDRSVLNAIDPGYNAPGRVQEGPKKGTLTTPALAELARKLAATMPDEMRTEKVLREGDMRALLAQVSTQGGLTDEDLAVGDETFTPRERQIAGALQIEKSLNLAEQIQTQLMAAGLSEEEAMVQATEWKRGYLDGTIKRLPVFTGSVTGVGPDGQVLLSSDASEDLADSTWSFDPTTGTEAAAAQVRYMSQADIVKLLQEDVSGDVGIRELMASERGMQAEADAAGVDVLGRPAQVALDAKEQSRRIYGLSPDKRGPGGFGDPTTVDMQKTYGLSEIARLPTQMSRAEVLAISRKLEKAGYYDLTGAKPVQDGNPYDPAFKKAWQTLMGQSIESKTPMMQLLDDRMAAFQEQLDERLVTRLTDPARIRINTDAVGQSMLGRKLRPDEHERMVQFVHDLERRNAKLEAGLDPDADEPDAEGTMADIEARIEEFMRGENDTEASAKEVSDQYGVFTKLLSGPGRGI
jgi:hypothetical protein